jgi:predicted phage tail protein
MSSDDFAEGARLRASGHLSRRRFMSRLVAGGMTASAAYAFLNATEGATASAAPASTAVLYGTPPSPPQALTATPGNSQVRLTWLLPANDGGSPITDYVIQRSPNGSSNWITINDGVRTTTSHTVTGLTNGTRYYFRVLAKNAEGNSNSSNVVSAMPRTVPSAPGSLRAVPGNRRVTLSWLLPASNGGLPITDFLIQQSTNGSAFATIADPVRTLPTHTVLGLTNGTRYSYRVLARSAAGNSAPSNVANAIPRTVPSAVRSLTATPGLSQQIRLSWLLPASNGGSAITDYVIQRSANGTSGWVTINDGVRTTTSHTVTGLTNGTRYFFRVLAKNAAGLGPVSNVANAVPRTVPSAPVLRAVPGSRRVTLSWLLPAANGAPITDYIIQRSANGTSGWTTINDGVSTARSFTVSGLTNGTRYFFRVLARNAAGNSAPSNVVNAVPR